MEEISVEKLYEYYLDTLNRCGMFLLNENDDVVEYEIFEEFDIGVASFLHLSSLERLLKANLISDYEMKRCLELRKMVIDLQSNDEWNLTAFRSSQNWKNVLMLTDEIKSISKG